MIRTAHGRQVLALLALASTGVWATTATAKDVTVDIRSVTDAGIGDKLGTIVIEEKDKGLSFKVDLTGIPAGEHGFHLHEKGDCGPGVKDGKPTAGVAAGPHFDPDNTKARGTQGRFAVPDRDGQGRERGRHCAASQSCRRQRPRARHPCRW